MPKKARQRSRERRREEQRFLVAIRDRKASLFATLFTFAVVVLILHQLLVHVRPSWGRLVGVRAGDPATWIAEASRPALAVAPDLSSLRPLAAGEQPRSLGGQTTGVGSVPW